MKNQSKKSKIFNHIFTTICIFSFLLFLLLGTFFIASTNKLELEIKKSEFVQKTIIYDRYNNPIELIGSDDPYVYYQDLPQVLIDSLLSIEDSEFFYHDGFNPKRILTSFVNNIFSNSLQGGSTISQQLIKNTVLTNEKTYNRKIKELYLSLLLEKEYSKEEILEFYFNMVYFEQAIPGIKYASETFFNKDVSSLNYIESALLVGLVKSPSYYYPFKYPDRANNRKNQVLLSMYQNNAISLNQYQLGIKTKVEDLLYHQEEDQQISYDYQAYLDVVYEEVKLITNQDLYTHPLIVETYLDPYLQSKVDQIQKGEIISFSDQEQQIGGAVIENEGAKIIALIGGRNYNGKKIFNRSYHLKRNPASTMKPLLSYPLAMEYLSYNPLTTIIDEPYQYLGTNVNVHNADKNYLGPLTLIDAIGYSRNTCAVKVFDQLSLKIGNEQIKDYLISLNLFDQGNLSGSYALGGMTYGISPIQVAGGYTFLSNHGQYLKPSTIKKITDYQGNVIYEREMDYEQIISPESADLITYSLKKVMDKNYLNINQAKPNGIDVAGKTGTNAYDQSTRIKYNLPSNADKDIWFSGYSKYHTIAIWSGFDEPSYQKNYFGYNDSKRKIPKQIFKYLMETINKKGSFTYSENLKKINLVKGLDQDYLPNQYTPSSLIEETLINPDKTKVTILPELKIEKVNDVDIFYSDANIIIQVNNPLIEDEVYSKLFGEKMYYLFITKSNGEKEVISNKEGYFDYPINQDISYDFEVKIGFKNNNNYFGEAYFFTFEGKVL